MNKRQRSIEIIKVLESLYPSPSIPLKHNNTFTLLCAVVLSAQATDKKVNEVTTLLFEKASEPKSMYSLGEQEIYNYIKHLGLSKQKSKYLFKLSEILINKFESNVPNNFSDLESLPGVGHKTASVVMAQAFNIATFPVDTHIHRLAQRWGLSNGSSVKQTEIDLKNIFPKEKWNKLHLQIIYYGREHCTARGCDGTKCLLCKHLYPDRLSSVKYNKA